jgi:hypothetical protein
VAVESEDDAPKGGKVYSGKSDGKPVEMVLDADGVIKRGRCVCGHHQRAGIRMGPCRHLLALREFVLRRGSGADESTGGWYDRLRKWAST